MDVRKKLLSRNDLDALPSPSWTVADFIQSGEISLVYGPPGSGKSLVALDLAAHVVLGRPWRGHATECGPVVCFNLEGVTGFARQRVPAVEARLEAPLEDLYLGRELSLFGGIEAKTGRPITPDGFGELLGELAALRPKLIVVDPLCECLGSADESSARDMAIVIRWLRLLRDATGAGILLLHHSGKNSTLGARGSSALAGAVASAFQVRACGTAIELSCVKMRDGDRPPPLRWRMVPASGPWDQASVVLEPETGAGAMVGDRERGALEALRRLDGAVSRAEWQTAAAIGRKADMLAAIDALVAAGLISRVGVGRTTRYAAPDSVPASREPKGSHGYAVLEAETPCGSRNSGSGNRIGNRIQSDDADTVPESREPNGSHGAAVLEAETIRFPIGSHAVPTARNLFGSRFPPPLRGGTGTDTEIESEFQDEWTTTEEGEE